MRQVGTIASTVLKLASLWNTIKIFHTVALRASPGVERDWGLLGRLDGV